jgi:hypothetical protein
MSNAPLIDFSRTPRIVQASLSRRAATARKLGDEAGQRCATKADEVCPGFGAKAFDFICAYADEHAQFAGEDCTLAMKQAGIQAHDDRATGSAYAKALRENRIRVVGYVPRVRGHGSAGGKLYAKAGV